MNKIIIIAILVLTVISCNKTNKDVSNESSVDNNEITERNTIVPKLIFNSDGQLNNVKYDYHQLNLDDNFIIYKENSLDKNNYEVDFDADYNIVLFNEKHEINETLITDKYLKTMILPNKSRINMRERELDDSAFSVYGACYILHEMDNNKYKLIFIVVVEPWNVKQGYYITLNEYIYENSFNPEYFTVIRTPNYFIVTHEEMIGIEYTIINRQTGSYETFDTEKREGH